MVYYHGRTKNGCEPVSDAAAFALCVTTTIRVGAFWEARCLGVHYFNIMYAHMYQKWCAAVWSKPVVGQEPIYAPTLESACLAALLAMAKE